MNLELLYFAPDHALLSGGFSHKNGIIKGKVINGMWRLELNTKTNVLKAFDIYSLLKHTKKIDTPYKLISVIIDQSVSVGIHYHGIIYEALNNVEEKDGKFFANISKDNIIKHHPDPNHRMVV